MKKACLEENSFQKSTLDSEKHIQTNEIPISETMQNLDVAISVSYLLSAIYLCLIFVHEKEGVTMYWKPIMVVMHICRYPKI